MDAGRRDRRTLARPAPRLRRTATVLVALALAGVDRYRDGADRPALAGRTTPAPAPVAIAAPVPALGPLAGTAPSADRRPVSAPRSTRWPARGPGRFTGS